jgi:hypothetical protein
MRQQLLLPRTSLSTNGTIVTAKTIKAYDESGPFNRHQRYAS